MNPSKVNQSYNLDRYLKDLRNNDKNYGKKGSNEYNL